MKLAEFTVKNYQFTLVIFLMIVVLGVTTLRNMPRSEDPVVEPPQFPVVVVYPGTSPQDMEEKVVDLIEKKVSELEDIKKIKSTISDGVAVVWVSYKHGNEVNDKYQELVREVNSLRAALPPGIQQLEVQKVDPTAVNILQLGLVSENASLKDLKQQAEKLQEELERLPQLKDVEIHGLPEEIVRVDLHLEKLASMNIPLPAVVSSLQGDMSQVPGGSVEAGGNSFNVKTGNNLRSVEDISNTIVFSMEGKNTLLKEVADVHPNFAEVKHITRLNGHRCLFVTAALKEGQNISKTQEAYLPLLEDFGESLPPNVVLVTNFDQADHVNKRLGGLGIDFLIAILLVSITLLPLGGRAALVVMISIPLSLSIGLVMLNVLGYSLNQLSIVGLVVALGLLVDDSIVVVENIERWLREGYGRLQATILATKQIGLAVVGCTVTLIIAFLPLVFLPESSGDFIRNLPMAVIASVLASMLVSLTIIPFLSSRILKEHAGPATGNIFLRALQKIIQGSYARLLDKALLRPVLTLVAATIIFGGALLLFPVIGFSLFPVSEKPQFLVNVRAPLQANLTYTDQLAREVEALLAQTPEVKYYATNVGKGNPRVYYNESPEQERTDFAQVFVQLQEDIGLAEKLELTEALRQKFSHFAGAKIEVKHFQQGPPVTAPVEVRLLGPNLDTLRTLAFQVEKTLKETEGTLYVTNPVSHLKSDFKVDVNKEKAWMLGVSPSDIARTVRLAVAGLPAGRFTDSEGEERQVLVTTPKQEHATLAAFDHLMVNNRQGKAFPLSQVADLRLETTPLTVEHFNKSRMVAVSAFVAEGFLTDKVIQEVKVKMDQVKLPAGYTYTMGGEFETRQETFSGFGTILIVTVFLFIAVLVLEFKTFKSTLIVLSVIPLGIVGAVLALFLTGNSLSFVAVIGMIALVGIEVKNSILLVDFTNKLREEGRSLEEAIREAGEVRFLPIVLTSLTAIGGLIPIAISSNPLIAPLAIVLIGGLVSSTLLSRIVTPVVYKLIPPAVQVQPKEEALQLQV
ncbi:efflux RND transporter permease subunit [Pontibacter sp. MBLB2868]|uniref:efflux RND transporter permease subunit n=1 Tax=Pontibacter sp. MBLB2868 TaxID=3451555 RepID=UPI003F750D20